MYLWLSHNINHCISSVHKNKSFSLMLAYAVCHFWHASQSRSLAVCICLKRHFQGIGFELWTTNVTLDIGQGDGSSVRQTGGTQTGSSHCLCNLSLTDSGSPWYLPVTVWSGQAVSQRPFNTPQQAPLTSLSCSITIQRDGRKTHPAAPNQLIGGTTRAEGTKAQEGRQGRDYCYWSRSP